MLVFLWPWLLWVAGVVAAVGAWALWRGQRQARAVSSVRFWRTEGEGETVRVRRRIDPIWVLVLLGGVLAALAAAGPTWRGRTVEKAARVQWAMRSVDGGVMEVWVRSDDGGLPERLVLETDGGVSRAVMRGELAEGVALALPGAASRVMVRLRDEAGAVRAECEFARPAGRAFGLVIGAGVDEALRRVFTVQTGAQVDDPSVRPLVEVVDGPAAADELEGAALVVAGPGAGLPGVTVGAIVSAPEGGWAPEVVEAGVGGAAVPSFVQFGAVRVRRVRAGEFGEGWRVVARVGGRPWIAERRVESGDEAWWVWLGSEVSTDTDWAKDPSFVLFFADLMNRAGGSAGGVVEWEAVPAEQGATRGAVVGLGGWLGVVAIGLLVVAAGLQGRRMMK